MVLSIQTLIAKRIDKMNKSVEYYVGEYQPDVLKKKLVIDHNQENSIKSSTELNVEH